MAIAALTPWNGDPISRSNPDGAVRVLPFGEGVDHLSDPEDQQWIDVLSALWLG
ncbi:MAG: hypothetical protein QOG76_2609 [Pseudonocardiales bacterium]|nr:hypothetical protein [Pseudonocardiales bacterium]